MTRKTDLQNTKDELKALDALANGDPKAFCLRVTDGSDQDDPKTWACNGLRFPSTEKALEYAWDLSGRWSGMRGWYVDIAPEKAIVQAPVPSPVAEVPYIDPLASAL